MVAELEFKTDVKLSQHNLSQSFDHMNPMFMTYNSGPLWLLILIMAWGIFCWATGCCQEEEEEDDQLCEGLAAQQEALKEDDKFTIIGEEETYISKYQTHTLTGEQLTKIKNSETADTEKIIMGVATYRILDNLEYQQALQYEPARYNPSSGTCERDNVIIISTQSGEVDPKSIVNEPLQQDATYLAINYPFIPDSKRDLFNMDTSEGKSVM